MSTGWMLRFAVTAVFAGAVAIGLSGVAAVTVPDGSVDATREAPALPVAAMKARLVSGYEVRREFVGRVEARRESRVGFELGGLVTAVLAEEGDHLEPGQIIARLDTARLKAQRKQLFGRRAELRANIELARATRIRQEQLAQKGHSSQQRYDEARFNE
ncbi:MAG: biotin/lipoyl-binding protein, partial [Alphaproteobacteria bacterium]